MSTTSIDIIRDHREHFIKRLISHSSLLKFIPNAYRMDIADLSMKSSSDSQLSFEESSPGAVSGSNGIQETNPVALLISVLKNDSFTIANPADKIIAKCRKIILHTDEFYHMTGQRSLYIGYPSVFVPLDGGRFIFAPLLLWPIDVRCNGRNVSINRRDDTEPIRNRIFNAWLKHEKNISINWVNGEEDDIAYDNLPEFVNGALVSWNECVNDFSLENISTLPGDPNKASKAFKSWAENGRKPEVLPMAVMGHASFKGQALLDDLDNLEGLLKDSSAKLGLLKPFLFPRDGTLDDEGKAPDENGKWLAVESDPSQEAIIWQSRKSPVMILQGPPGTGKSQTIVNLIADAMANGKSVLVVCQKRAALDVILKRMNAIKLGEFSILVESPFVDRSRVISQLRDINTGTGGNPLLDASSRKTATRCIRENEKKLDDYISALNHGAETLYKYGDLNARLLKLKTKGVDINRTEFDNFRKDFASLDPVTNRDMLQDRLSEVDNIIKLYTDINYNCNPWRHIKPDANVIASRAELEPILNQMVSDARCSDSDERKETGFKHPERISWLVEHPLLDEHYSYFISEKLRDTHRRFLQLLSNIKKLGKWLPDQRINHYLSLAREQNVLIEEFKTLQGSLNNIGDVLFIARAIQNKPLITTLHKYCQSFNGCWVEIVEAATLYLWLEKLIKEKPILESHLQDVDIWRGRLENAIKQKRDTDISHIRCQYNNRVSHINELENNNLGSSGYRVGKNRG